MDEMIEAKRNSPNIYQMNKCRKSVIDSLTALTLSIFW